MALAYHFNPSGVGGPGGGGGPGGAPPGSVPGQSPGPSQAVVNAALSQLGLSPHPLLNFGPPPPPPSVSHNGAIPGPGSYRELSDRYAQELLLSHNIERIKREEAAAIVADQNLQSYYSNRLANGAVSFPGFPGISGLNPTVAALVAAQHQAQANNAAVAAAAAQLSANSNSAASSAGATSMSSGNPSISTMSSSSSRRRPSLLPHNSGPTNAEAFNLALNSSSSGSTNGSSSLANSRNAGLHFNDREKFELFSRYSPYESSARSGKSNSGSDRTGPSPHHDLRVPSSSSSSAANNLVAVSSISSVSPYAHHLSQSMAGNSHHVSHSLPSSQPQPLLIPPPPSGAFPLHSPFNPAIVSSSAPSSSTGHQHHSVLTSHYSTPSSSSASVTASGHQHHHASPHHLQQHSNAPSAHLHHNHLSPGHLLNEIHEAKRPRLMSLSGGDVGQSFAAAMAAANAGGMHHPTAAPPSLGGGLPGGNAGGNVPGSAASSSSASTASSATLAAAASLAGLSQQGAKLSQELLIDTRAVNEARDKDYTSTFEAISPTPNDESQLAEVQLQREKEELLAGINSLEREISKMTSHIDTLHKKKNELEEMTSKTSGDGEEDKQKAEPKEPTIEQKIYSTNNMLAMKAHKQFDKLGPLNDLPLYNQATDLAIVRANYERFKSFRKVLVERIRRQNAERVSHVKCLCESYDKNCREWLKKMEKKECTTIKKAKDQKLRDYFERQFQELRKQREDKERLQRSGQRIRSEAELDEIIDGLQVQAMEDQKMRSYAVIPPIMFDSTMKPPAKYDNRNGFIEDPFLLYKEVENINIWTEGEKEIFREKYLQHPKNFGLIASFLERKSVADCVQYYYHSKKKEKYKELLKKHAKKRTRALAKQQQAANAHSAHRGSPMMKDAPEKGGALKSYVGKTASATSVILPYATPLTSSSSTITFTISSNSASAIDSKVSTASSAAGGSARPVLNRINQNRNSSTLATTSNAAASATAASTSSSTKPSDSVGDSVKVKFESDTHSDAVRVAANDATTTTADPGDGTCCKCSERIENCQGGFVKSRAVSQANMCLYSIAEYRAGLRVCKKCHQKHVCRQCPISSCNIKRKLKHLKTLPVQWVEMPLEQRQRYAAELDIPVDARIGCARCVMRISRKIGIVTNSVNSTSAAASSAAGENNAAGAGGSGIGGKATTKADIRRCWSEAEVDQLRTLIRAHGKNWQQIAAGFGGIKSANDCKKLFCTNKRECNLSTALHEYNESTGKSAARSGAGGGAGGASATTAMDTDSDDELSDDSGEETSSVEDLDRNSDTASASSQLEGQMALDDAARHGSALIKTANTAAAGVASAAASIQQPPPPSSLADLKALSASQGSLKSDYDSSATMSADEGNAADGSGAAASAAAMNINLSSTGALPSSSSSISSSSTTTCSGSTLALFGRAASTSAGGGVSAASSIFGPSRTSFIDPSPSSVPSFLINPNAPTLQPSLHHLSTANLSSYNSSLSSSILSGGHSSASSVLGSVSRGGGGGGGGGGGSLSTINGASAGGNDHHGSSAASGKEEPTCVRDLIYKAIEMSLQPGNDPAKSSGSGSGGGGGGSASLDVPSHRAPSHSLSPNPQQAASSSSSSSSHHHFPPPGSSGQHHRPSSTSSEPPTSSNPYAFAMNLKRANTPNDLSKMDILASTALHSSNRKPEGFSTYFASSSMQHEDEVQDLSSKKPSSSMSERKPSLQPQIEALRPSSRGSPYKQQSDRLSVSSSPGLRASPSLKSGAHPPQALTPTMFQQQFGGLPPPPQPAHSGAASGINSAMRLDPAYFGVDAAKLNAMKNFSSANMLFQQQQQLQQQQHQQQQHQSSERSKSMKSQQQQQQQLVLTSNMHTGMSSSGGKNPASFVQLSPKSGGGNHAGGGSSSSYRDKLPTAGSIIQGTPVISSGGQQQQQQQQQQQLPVGLMAGKFPPPPPPSQASQHYLNNAHAHASYEAMIRRMNVGSITAGTPLPMPGMPGGPPMSSLSSGSSGRKDGGGGGGQSASDLQKAVAAVQSSMMPRGPGNMFDPTMMEHLYKRNATASPNAQQTAALVNAAYGHRPFSPNFSYSVPPGVMPPGLGGGKGPTSSSSAAAAAAAAAAGKDAIANQLLIDFNTSKQMQSRRSSASSEKEQQQEAAMLMKQQQQVQGGHLSAHRPPSHGPPPPHHFHVAPSPSPNSQMYERAAVIRGEESAGGSHRSSPGGPLQPPPLPPPGMMVGPPLGFASDAVFASQWQNLNNLQYSLNRQNVIQQGWTPGHYPPPPPPPVSTPLATSAKASVIQAPKSSSPRTDHHLLSAGEVKRNSVSPLVTGGTNASASGHHHFGGNAVDAFTTLVNTWPASPSKSMTSLRARRSGDCSTSTAVNVSSSAIRSPGSRCRSASGW